MVAPSQEEGGATPVAEPPQAEANRASTTKIERLDFDMRRDPIGYFALVLHSHLPFVLGHGRWPHGSDWLSEVTVSCYLPLLDAISALAADGISPRATINISPVLAEQLAAPSFPAEIEEFLRTRLAAARENRDHFTREGRSDLAGLTQFWERLYHDRLAQFERLNGNLIQAFRHLADEGHIHLITCAATHAYLPLLSREESIDLQIRLAVATHTRHFGRAPEGIWLPECAYRPRYEWTPPLGSQRGRVRLRRRGLEEFLSDHSLKFFFTDLHLVRGGGALSAYRDFFPALKTLSPVEGTLREREGTPYHPYLAASRGGSGSAVAFVRDPESTMQVWSRDLGYPGDDWYLEFHKKHFPGGLQYWRVTQPKSDLAHKEAYDPDRASARTEAHADHFVALLRRVLTDYRTSTREPGLSCSPYDTELFGHWWFEGPRWLQQIYRRLAHSDIDVTDCRTYLDRVGSAPALGLLEGSWGEGGDHRVWLNRDTEWTWEMIYRAEEEFWALARQFRTRQEPLLRRVMAQLSREMVLLQASDWQFLITTWAARDYAEARFIEHFGNVNSFAALLRRLADGGQMTPGDEELLGARERQNFAFADIAAHVDKSCDVPAA